jgi:DNA-binding response OmpR family regulator
MILVVDDDERLQKMLSFFFVKKGFKVIGAKDGIAALKILESFRPDIILLDLAMPDMDGFELCRRIKEDSFMENIPLIAISALSASENRQRILSMGVSDFFEKPFEVACLLKRVSKLLGSNEGILIRNVDKLNYKGDEL